MAQLPLWRVPVRQSEAMRVAGGAAVIAHMSYVMCDRCGNPAELADDAKEARAAARREGFVCAALDLCRQCAARREYKTDA